MENRTENETFRYTYSAREQEEVKNIRKKYVLTDEEDKMARLRRLDAGVYRKASSAALAVGIIGALVMGFGMSLAMTEISAMLGTYRDLGMFIGVIVGSIGIAGVCLAYPVYSRVLHKEREKIAPEILRLTDELMK